MALISNDNLKKIDKERNHIHGKEKGTYTAFENDGNIYFQIDTYGSPSREIKDKISQSLQFDEKSAKAIVEILRRTYSF